MLAALGRPEAVPRLLRAIHEREDGCTDRPAGSGPTDPRAHLARNWIAAIALLRTCADASAIPHLTDLAADPLLPFDAAVALAITLGRIAMAHHGAIPAGLLLPIADALLQRFGAAIPLPPHRCVNLPPAETLAAGRSDTAEDHSWQLRLAVADLHRSVGLETTCADILDGLSRDPRSHVRRAAALRRRRCQQSPAPRPTPVGVEIAP